MKLKFPLDFSHSLQCVCFNLSRPLFQLMIEFRTKTCILLELEDVYDVNIAGEGLQDLEHGGISSCQTHCDRPQFFAVLSEGSSQFTYLLQ